MADVAKKAEEKKAVDKKNTDRKKSDKPNIFKRIANWFKSLKSEAKKISWASWKSVRTNSIIVIVVVIIIAIALGVLDVILTSAVSGLGRLL